MPEEAEKKKISKTVLINILEFAKDWRQVMHGLTPKQAASHLSDLREGYLVDAMRMFEEMEKRDPDIKADLGLRKNSIAHRKITVHPAEDSTEAKKQAEWLEAVLKTPALKRLPQLMTDAIPKGFALLQMNFKYEDKFVVPDQIQRIPPWGLLMRDFASDKIVEFPMLTDKYGLAGTPIERNEQLIFHKHFDQDFTFLNSGLMYTLVLAYILRNYGQKDWAAFLERFGLPMVVAHSSAVSNATEKEVIRQAVQDLQNDLAAVLDENSRIEIIETKSSGATPFERMLNVTRDFISKVTLGQTLSTNESQFGTKAQAVVHAGVRQDLLEYDAFAFELTLNEQLVKNLIDMNFGNPLYPRIQIDTRGDATKEDIQAGFDMGLEVSIKQIRSVLNLREPEDKDDTLLKTMNAAPTQIAASESKKKEYEDLILKEDKKITFDDILQGAIDKAAGGYNRLEVEILKNAEKGYEYAIEHIWDLYAELNADLGAVLSDAASAAEIIGIDEAKREAEGEEIALSETTFSDNPVPPDEGLKYLKRKPVVSSRQFKALSSKWKGRMFSVAGYDNLKALGKAHEFLMKAYEEGLSFEDFRIRVNAYFRNQGLIAPDRFHLRTVFETNMQSAYMAGRIRQMLENVDERPYWRILTAGDDRVRPAHRALHGKVFHYREIIEKNLIPPLDYNCRCTLQALTAEQVKQLGLKIEEKALAIYDDPETGLPVNIRPREGFGHNPDDYIFSSIKFIGELPSSFRDEDNLIDWEKAGQPDARTLTGTEKPPEAFINLGNIKRNNPDISNDELKLFIKKSIAEKYPSLMTGWPERFELSIPTVFKENVIFNEQSLIHIFDEKFFDKGIDRITDFPKFIDTIQNPWEVWVNQNKTTKEWGLSYFKIWEGKTENLYCRVDIYPSEGAKVVTYFMSKDKAYFNKNRQGVALIYKNNDLVRKK